MNPTRPAGPGHDDPWVAVAKILRPHGLDGMLRLHPFSRDPEDLLDPPVRAFHVRRGDRILGPFEWIEGRMHQGIILARLKGIADRTAAEALTNGELVVREEEFWQPPEGHYYIHLLRGLEVRDAGTAEVLGTVRDAKEGGAHDYLILDLPSAHRKGVMLPLIPQYVPRIDLEGGFVEVLIPEGLLE